LEIVEHVNQPHQFLATCTQLLRPGGMLCISTINRTPMAYMMGIWMAEQVLRWVPSGTHEYDKFIRPPELLRMLSGSGVRLHDQAGMWYNPLTDRWSLVHETTAGAMQMNYIVAGVKQ
jgi:2-polyprenyl-6-hydroxyphenyl methylase/3-demethylubiquinone-9 3-methyltransferase